MVSRPCAFAFGDSALSGVMHKHLSTALAFVLGCTLSIFAVAAMAAPRYLLVGGLGNSKIAVIAVDRDGKLTPVGGSPVGGRVGFAIVITHDAKTAYVGSLRGAITGYRIGTDGTLTRIAAGSLEVDKAVIGLAFSPDGTRLYATVGNLIGGNSEVRSYSVEAASGALRPTGAPAV